MDIELQNVLNWIIFNGSWQKPSDEERKVADQFLERTPRKSKEPGFTKKKRKPKSQYSKTTLSNQYNIFLIFRYDQSPRDDGSKQLHCKRISSGTNVSYRYGITESDIQGQNVRKG